MQSHLTISYTSSTPASGTPAVAAPSVADADAGDNPLGFLAALIDQIIGQSASPSVAADANAEIGPSINNPAPGVDGLLNVKVDVPTPNEPRPADARSLLAKLNEELDKLKSELDGGESPDPEVLKKLSETINALVALLNGPSPPVVTLKGTDVEPLVTQLDVPAPSLISPVDDLDPSVALRPAAQAAPRLLVSANTAPPPTTPPTSEPLPGVAELTAKIDTLARALAPLAPQAAQQLQALSTKLTAVQSDPTLLTPLTASADADGTTPDIALPLMPTAKQVPTTPQLAANAQLQVPEAIVPKPAAAHSTASAVDATEPGPVAPPPIPPSAIKLAVSEKVATPADESAAKLDAKITALATAVTTDSKADTTSAAPAAVTVSPNTQPAAATNAARTLPAAYQPVANPINMAQVAFEMVRQAHQGQSRFTIRIDPPELGRVDVKMHVDGAGNVNARLTVERSETLDMFQRDRGTLEKALSQAGLDAGKTNLEFSLKQQQNPFAGMAGGDQQRQSQTYGAPKFTGTDDDSSVAPVLTLYRGTASAAGVNLFV